MTKRNLILLFIAFVLLLNGCGYVVTVPQVPDNEEHSIVAQDATLIPTSTFTPSPTFSPTNTPEPTVIPTETLVPTPTVILGVESEIDPYIVRELEGEYKGIKIKARVIIDRSLEYLVESFEVKHESYYVQVLAEILANVWYLFEYEGREPGAHYVTIRQTKQYFPLWQKAQETGIESDWRKAQLNGIWANDLNDGNGYVQEPYTLWPMYEGEVPEGVKAFNRITVVVIDQSNSDITNIRRSTETGFATHIDGNDLVIYSGIDFKHVNEEMLLHIYPAEHDIEWVLLFSFADFAWNLAGNIGDNSKYYGPGAESDHLAKVKYGFDITLR